MNSKERIIAKIFDDPSRVYYIRELAREAKISPNTVISAIDGLEKEGIIRKRAKKHIVEIAANLDSPQFKARKKLFNLSEIYKSKIIDFLIKFYNPKAIIMFGSYSRGEDVKGSDIDIAVIIDKKEIANLEAFEKRLNRHIHLLSVQFKDIPDELYANLINGIVVYGYLDKK